jgi:hypothetical protein
VETLKEVVGQAAQLVRESDLAPLLGKIAQVTGFAALMFLLAGFFPALTTAAVVASVAVLALA